MTRLLPCPFCGCEPVMAPAVLNVGQSHAIITCINEDCFGPRTTAGNFEDNARQWNTRATQQDGAWQPIETAPGLRTLELWHHVWKCVVTARIDRPNRVIEETKTTQWPLEAFSHWRAPSQPPRS